MHARTRIVSLGALTAMVLALGAVPAGGLSFPEGVIPTVESVSGSASGASIDLLLTDPPIEFQDGPTPLVELPPEGGADTDAVPELDYDIEGDAFQLAGPIEVSTEGALGESGSVRSAARVAEANGLFVYAEAVEVECHGGFDESALYSTSTTITGGESEILPEALPESPEPNTVITDSFEQPTGGGVLAIDFEIGLNEQSWGDEGGVSVTGMRTSYVVEFVPAEGEPELVADFSFTFGHASCGLTIGDAAGEDEVAPPVRVTPRFTG